MTPYQFIPEVGSKWLWTGKLYGRKEKRSWAICEITHITARPGHPTVHTKEIEGSAEKDVGATSGEDPEAFGNEWTWIEDCSKPECPKCNQARPLVDYLCSVCRYGC